MTARFEIVVNGERVCISGLEGDGVLATMVNFVKHADEDGKYELSIGGLGRFLSTQDHPHHADWPKPSVSIGDEITIRILPEGEFDLPQNMIGSPRDSIADEQFGDLNYNINAWDGDIGIDCPPFTQCHVHLWADDDGPSDSQRQRFADFLTRHNSLWPSIAAALVRCHTEIDSINELVAKIHPRVCINMQPDDTELELAYSVDGDPEFRGYFVTLRDWQITEVCMAE